MAWETRYRLGRSMNETPESEQPPDVRFLERQQARLLEFRRSYFSGKVGAVFFVLFVMPTGGVRTAIYAAGLSYLLSQSESCHPQAERPTKPQEP